MSRSRASVDGGYARKTISLPSDLNDRIASFLAENPGMTMSSFMTRTVEEFFDKGKKKKK